MIAELETLKNDYDLKQQLYNSLCNEFITQLNALFNEHNISLVAPIQYRVKTWNSIVDKCQKYNLTPEIVGDINDIAGLRIMLLYKKDILKVCDIIEKNFTIMRREDTGERLGDNQFGYGSIHFEVTPLNEWTTLPTLKRLAGLRAEVQVRTASQHIWAASSHLLQYKNEEHVPIPLRRSLNRIAAILELVDIEFDRLLEQRDTYINNIDNLEKKNILNVDILSSLIQTLLPKNQTKFEENDKHYAEIIDDLNFFDINTIEQFEELITNNAPEVFLREKKRAEEELVKVANGISYYQDDEGEVTRLKAGHFYTPTGLIRISLRVQFGDDTFDQYMKRFDHETIDNTKIEVES
ncbi:MULTISPECIES: GTP pyrophosphokinase [unclassified Paenibacillus]|uniref:GTP pyrophosphokinase n=1 Tax=unclassified Paenibacillus TaxID=185978 RepID=UPI0030F5D1E8